MLLALSTSHKLGLAITAAVFVAFALASSFLLPRYRPDFPGSGLRLFIAATVVLFVGMLAAVEIFGKESEEAAAEGGEETTETTPGATTAGGETHTIKVAEKDFKILLPETHFAAGKYVFQLTNNGPSPHDLAIDGPGVENRKTPVIAAGKTASLEVTLEDGDYDFYCSVPGHKQLGMDEKVTVG